MLDEPAVHGLDGGAVGEAGVGSPHVLVLDVVPLHVFQPVLQDVFLPIQPIDDAEDLISILHEHVSGVVSVQQPQQLLLVDAGL